MTIRDTPAVILHNRKAYDHLDLKPGDIIPAGAVVRETPRGSEHPQYMNPSYRAGLVAGDIAHLYYMERKAKTHPKTIGFGGTTYEAIDIKEGDLVPDDAIVVHTAGQAPTPTLFGGWASWANYPTLAGYNQYYVPVEEKPKRIDFEGKTYEAINLKEGDIIPKDAYIMSGGNPIIACARGEAAHRDYPTPDGYNQYYVPVEEKPTEAMVLAPLKEIQVLVGSSRYVQKETHTRLFPTCAKAVADFSKNRELEALEAELARIQRAIKDLKCE